MTRACVAIAGLVFLACAGSGPGARGRPEWVDGTASGSSGVTHVTAAASGSDLEAARRNARTELSRVFHSRVQSEVRDQTKSTFAAGRSSVVENLSIDTRVSTEGSFEGVRVVKTWQEPKTGTWHALASVEKEAMRRTLLVALKEAARRVHGDLVRADTAPTPLGRARALLDALRASSERDVIVARARLVGRPSVRFLPTTAEIEKELDSVLWNTRFQVRALEVDPSSGQANGDLPRLREELEKRITRIGFRVVGFVAVEGTGSAPLQPEAEQANVFLTCRMSLEEIPRDFEGHFFRWQGAYEVTGAPPHGAVIMASQASGGESFRTRSTARMRALTKGAEQLAGELETQISRYLGEGAGH